MRIAWVTPLARGSGISKFSLPVVRELSRRADVDVWAPVTSDDYECPWGTPVAADVCATSAERLSAYDAVFYNMGDHPAYHAETYGLYERAPGIVILHDKRMHGFFHDYWGILRGQPERYAALMQHYYGAEGAFAAARILRGREGLDDDERFPLLEPCLFNALGAVAHSEECAGMARERYEELLPVVSLALPFALGDVVDESALLSRAALGVPADRLLVVTHGGVFPAKRVEAVIRAIAASEELSARCQLAVVGGGSSDYIARLESLARELGIAERVQFTHRVDDATMYSWVRAADICVNLRYPSIESSSLTLIEQMSFGKPVIVTDTSYYAELPDGLVFKVSVDNEVPEVAAALELLAADPELRGKVGEEAARFVSEEHSPARYVDGLLEFAKAATGARAVLQGVDAEGETLLAAASAESALAELERAADALSGAATGESFTP